MKHEMKQEDKISCQYLDYFKSEADSDFLRRMVILLDENSENPKICTFKFKIKHDLYNFGLEDDLPKPLNGAVPMKQKRKTILKDFYINYEFNIKILPLIDNEKENRYGNGYGNGFQSITLHSEIEYHTRNKKYFLNSFENAIFKFNQIRLIPDLINSPKKFYTVMNKEEFNRGAFICCLKNIILIGSCDTTLSFNLNDNKISFITQDLTNWIDEAQIEMQRLLKYYNSKLKLKINDLK